MTNINLLYGETEEDLRGSVRDFLADQCDTQLISALYDGAEPPPRLWHGMAQQLGLADLLIPERFGGAGAGPREAAVVCEEIGRSVAPVPFLTSAVVAATILSRAASREAPLATLLDPGRIAVLAVPATAGPSDPLAPMTVAPGAITGRVPDVIGANGADLLLVPAPMDGGLAVFAVSAADASIAPVRSFDMTRPLADITLADAPAQMLLDAAQGAAAVQEALLLGMGMIASEQLGIARWCLDETLHYLRIRQQFGRVVGSFQALKHRLADLFVEVESAAAAARYAAGTLAEQDPDAPIAVRVAKDYCSRVAVRSAEEALQLHGGIGMTWEHPLHLYLKRAKANALGLGGTGRQREQLAALIDLPGPVG